MRKDEEVKELFRMNLDDLEHDFKQKAIVTENGIWITIQFGTLYTVTGRGYLNALKALDEKLDELVES